jgi:predicted NBD/HSP70 family sugar kinase
MREGSRKRVCNVLRERGAASRAEIARTTGLSRTTVSTIVTDLIEDGLAHEREEQQGADGHTGRPPVMLSLNRSAGVALGLDFGHRHLRVAVADLSHAVLAETWCELDVDHSAEEGLDRAAEFVEQVLAEAGADRSQVIGTAMGLPAPIDRTTGAVEEASILPGWVGVDAAGEASRRLGLPIEVENDANLGALAELTWGAAKGSSDVVFLKVSSGIGAGLITGGKLQHGASGTAGEVGHMVLSEGGPVCRCGNRGCLEALASGPAVADLLASSRREPVTTRQLLELCAAGDAAAVRLIADAGRAIGVGVASLCNILNPQSVVVGGDLAAAGDVLLDPIRGVVGRMALPTAAADVEIIAGVLGDRAEMLGAVALVMHESDRFDAAEARVAA